VEGSLLERRIGRMASRREWKEEEHRNIEQNCEWNAVKSHLPLLAEKRGTESLKKKGEHKGVSVSNGGLTQVIGGEGKKVKSLSCGEKIKEGEN